MRAFLLVALLGTPISADTNVTNLGVGDAEFIRYSANYARDKFEVEIDGEFVPSLVDVALYSEDHADASRQTRVSSVSANPTGLQLTVVPEPSGKEMQLLSLLCLLIALERPRIA